MKDNAIQAYSFFQPFEQAANNPALHLRLYGLSQVMPLSGQAFLQFQRLNSSADFRGAFFSTKIACCISRISS